METVDVVALVILAVALFRGFWIGMIREGFSLAAVGAAILAVRYAGDPAAAWVTAQSPIPLGEWGARIAGGALLAVTTIAVVGLVGRTLRRGLLAAGLGMADRFAGGVLGATEGALVVALLVWAGVTAVGRDHPALTDTRALAGFERVERIAQERLPGLPGVAAPPRSP